MLSRACQVTYHPFSPVKRKASDFYLFTFSPKKAGIPFQFVHQHIHSNSYLLYCWIITAPPDDKSQICQTATYLPT